MHSSAELNSSFLGFIVTKASNGRLSVSFIGLSDPAPHPFPILSVRLSRCMRG
jgi:hypothetical protein